MSDDNEPGTGEGNEGLMAPPRAPRTRGKGGRVMPPDDDSMVSAQEQEENESYQQITDMLKANDLEGGTIRISRRGPGETGHSYCTKIKVQEFDIEFVKKTFGGGDYICQCFRANGQLGRRFTFSIDARFKGSLDTTDRGVMGVAQDNGSAMVKMVEALRQDNKGSDMTPILQTMMKASSDNMAMMMAMMQQSTQMMTSAMTSIATMAASGKKDGGDESMKALVPVLVAMINKPSAPVGSIEETVKTMALLKGMYEPQGGGDGEDKEEGLLDKVFKLGGPLISALVAARQGGGVPMVVPPQRQLPAPGGQAQHQAQPQHQPQHHVQHQDQAQHQEQAQPAPAPSQEILMLGMFLHGAEKDSDPGLYHDLLMDLVQENQVEVMEEVLKSENYLDLLYSSSPEALAKAKQHKAWFDELRSLVLNSIASTRGGMLSGAQAAAPAAAPAAASTTDIKAQAAAIEDDSPQGQE